MNTDQTEVKTDLSPPAVAKTAEPRGSVWHLLVIYTVVVAVTSLIAGLVWSPAVAVTGLWSGLFCFLAALSAHFLAIYPRGDVFMLARLYQSAAIRIGLPVAFLFVCKLRFQELFAQGMVYFVILFYLVGLLTDLMVQVKRLKHLKAAGNPAMGQTARGNSQAG